MRRLVQTASLCTMLLVGCKGEAPPEAHISSKEPDRATPEKNWQDKLGFHSSYVQVRGDGTVVRVETPQELNVPTCEEGICSTVYFAKIEENGTRCTDPGPQLYAQIIIHSSTYEAQANIYDCDFDLTPEVVEQWMIFTDETLVNLRAIRDDSGIVVEDLEELNSPNQAGTQEQLEKLAVQAYERRSQEFREWAEQEDLLGQIDAYEQPTKEYILLDAGRALRLPE